MPELSPWLTLIFRRKGRLMAGAGLLLGTLLSGIGLLALSGWFLTETALVGLLLAAGVQAYINLYVPGGGIRFFAVSRTVFRYLERVYNHNTVLKLLTDIRVELFNQLARRSRSARNHQSGAQWLSRLTADVDALDTLYLRLIAPAGLAAVVTLIIVGAAWLLFNGVVALALLAILTAALLTSTWLVYLRTRAASGELSDRQESLRGELIEHLEGFAELTAAGRTGKHTARLMRRSVEISRDQARVDSRAGWHQAVSHLLINMAAVVALWLGCIMFEQGALSGPVLVLLPIALLGLAEVYAVLPDAFGKLGATRSAARRLNSSAQTQPERPELPDRLPTLTGDRAIMASNLTIGYPECPPLLGNFTLELNRGDTVGVVGRSGSGKSTLADTLAGLLPPCAGHLHSLPCAYLTQSTVVFEDTVRANLLLADPAADDGDLWRVLELVGLGERFSQETEGLNVWLGSAGNRLSGGEARRLVLARVLLSTAPVIVLDEPFTGVDEATRESISPAISRWLKGRTVISLGHGPEALLASDRIIRLS
ncbi:thiol reductant ABC exporter subunit CydC [Marinobacter sp. VGCF2001]|uniref:thiol reductant ABC exporter subunit CydC n=1 Tax=Marinobacter sp. VGCF2001 TaxID=3417189 RepID=UPI003CE67481